MCIFMSQSQFQGPIHSIYNGVIEVMDEFSKWLLGGLWSNLLIKIKNLELPERSQL